MDGSDAATSNTARSDWTARDIRNAVPADAIARLSAPAPWRASYAIGFNIAVIALLIAAAETLGTWWAAALAIPFIAGRQHAMLVLMHDASHRLLYRDARLNDAVSNLLLSFPLFVSTGLYRRHHLLHHRYTNTADDPDLEDTVIPPNGVLFVLQLLGDLLGLRSLKMLASVNSFGVLGVFKADQAAVRGNAGERRLFLAFAATLIAGLTLTGAWGGYLLYWIVPMWFALPPILHLRAVAEHAGRTQDGFASHARSVAPMPLERALFCPMNINLHLEHHVFPDIPAHRLPEVSRLLDAVPGLTDRMRRNRGYLFGPTSVLSELYAGRWRTA